MEFRERYGPWAIVAGASEGTGQAFARQLAQRGLNCLLIANAGPLEALAEEIREAHAVECETARVDLAASDAFERIEEALGAREVGLYVANAGSDWIGSRYLDHDVSGWLALLHLNVVTTMRACHHFGARMRERGRGGLLIVNSGACYGGGSFLATYAGCKGFLLNFTEGLWAELRPAGVDVLTMVLGRTDTPMLRRLLERTGMPVPPDLAAPEAVPGWRSSGSPTGRSRTGISQTTRSATPGPRPPSAARACSPSIRRARRSTGAPSPSDQVPEAAAGAA